MMKTIILCCVLSAATASLTKIATFDGAAGTTYKWSDMNDPVMGGRSSSTLTQTNNLAIFNGTCAIIPFLKAPGFAKITTNRGETGFPDISSHLAGYMELRVRSTTPSYDGFRLGFSAKDV